MSDMSLNHDLFREAAERRHREVEAIVRSRAQRHALRSAGHDRAARGSVRARVIAVAGAMLAAATSIIPGGIR